jgi:pimeloyl-ACP methyl ester carboxylesterase
MIRHRHVALADVTLHVAEAGAPGRPAAILVHGWPQSWFEWREVMPRLAGDFHVVAPDLRGLGDSSRPATGYDKLTLGRDIVRLAASLGLERWAVIGHDWGGPVAVAAALEAPGAVTHLGVFDVTVPGIGPDVSQGGRRWHHAFHRTLALPEALTAGRERVYLEWFYRAFSWTHEWLTPAVLDEFTRVYAAPGAMTAGFALYRAMLDDAAAFKARAAAGARLAMPVLTLGGGRSEAMGRGDEPARSLGEIAARVEHHTVADAGHFLVDEKPAEVAGRIAAFLSR